MGFLLCVEGKEKRSGAMTRYYKKIVLTGPSWSPYNKDQEAGAANKVPA
ncbi:hypothetical protein KNP414_02978 [Paenibacillus mucilaginosus KNP414]|uniref:Uncharacterized protein n=1 Tax=Paenibacillus mucilaginosus (strain KNP414) TaxID=1036673 RepID=F8F5X2_PAEMK|nr:hypothetical protein KNP414_02978 [Paenibacillus mucilaginosus KNP414]